jgi:lipoprotein-releasing system permease protein
MRWLTIRIATRYLFAKKSTSAINIISAISSVGIFIGCVALVVVLSAFNGFEDLISRQINGFDPDLKILPVEGKTFDPDSINLELESIEVIRVLEENVVVLHGEGQEIATVKGVDTSFYKSGSKDSLLVIGSFDLGGLNDRRAVFGAGLASFLGINPGYRQEYATLYVPNRYGEYNPIDPSASLSTVDVLPVGIFMVHEEVDDQYLIVPFGTAETLLQKEGEVSHLEVYVKPGFDLEAVQSTIQQKLGNRFEVKNRKEQNELIYKVFRTEKWSTYAILSFILLIAAFNIIGSLSMLVLEKKSDIGILKSMGAEQSQVHSIFLLEGVMISWIGGFAGVLVGLLVVWSQIQWGWLQMENSIVSSYPVIIEWADIALILSTVLILGFICAYYPARNASQFSSIVRT